MERNGLSGHSRRKVLGAGALLALSAVAVPLTGCGLLDRDPAPGPDPLAPLIDESLRLAAAHRAAATAHPALADRLTPIADAHTAHAAELALVVGTALPSASATPAPTTPADEEAALTALQEAERAGRESATNACAAAPSERAALVGSIAAARATHAEALK